MLYPLNYGGIYEIYKSYAFVGYPLFLHKKLRQGATQGTKSLRDFLQARVFAVSLTFSRVFTHITKGEQHLRRPIICFLMTLYNIYNIYVNYIAQKLHNFFNIIYIFYKKVRFYKIHKIIHQSGCQTGCQIGCQIGCQTESKPHDVKSEGLLSLFLSPILTQQEICSMNNFDTVIVADCQSVSAYNILVIMIFDVH